VLIPRGDTVIHPGDHLFLITTPDNVDTVARWLARQEQVHAG
jgi:Trk K+ transport system NAD-binding subunit